ncbi:MAG: glycine--tRNA ligase subunit beta [Burkholderiales bacterium]|nr:glycine--tRNA ligase subunit beta [Burkholderiales bacterium]
MGSSPLLVELLVEELPPKALKTLGEAFARLLTEGLKAEGLAAADAAVTAFATPRRLAVQVAGVAARAADRRVRSKLMPVAVGLDAGGAPTPALLKKLAALGADASVVPQLQREGEGKAETLFLAGTVAGATLAAGLQKALGEAVAKLPIPKVMQYQLHQGEGADFQPGWTSVHFVRPAHGLVALHGADVVPVSVLGLQAGRTTRGHRFEAAVDPIVLRDADSYAAQLRDEGAVIASYDERAREIVRQLRAASKSFGARLECEPPSLTDAEVEQVLLEDPLVNEVTALVERPNALACSFDEAFLAVPPECLILTMKANQKYFPLLDAQGRLSNQFLVVSNIRPADPGRIVEGNERVVRPRLADARFFYDQDRRRTLASRVPQLDQVVYHGKLGTQGERVERVRALARKLVHGAALGGWQPWAQDPKPLMDLVDRAALLAKADLLSDMVGEFPELQGSMGRYYALYDEEDPRVAEAIEDQYKPRFSGDNLPRSDVGLMLALADKLETLAGLFGIGQLPSGDKDPFALRRHALGVIRMLIERALPLDSDELVQWAFAVFGPQHGQAQAEVGLFLRERLVGYLREQGHGVQEVDAVLEVRGVRWADLPARLAALRRFAELPEAPALAAANKRIGNILRKSDAAAAPGGVRPALLHDEAETALHRALREVAPRADAAYDAGDLAGSLQALAALKGPVDTFFDRVMVNADDPALRANRLALLAELHATMNRVADLSRLAG